MGLFVLRRVLVIIPLLFIVSIVVFALTRLNPADPASLMPGAQEPTAEQITAIRSELGLDKSAVEQYSSWLSGFVRGDLGRDFETNQSVASLIQVKLPVTLMLMSGALLVSVLVGVPAGIIGALRAGKPSDRAVSLVSSMGLALPGFLLGYLLIAFLAVRWQLFPVIWPSGTDVGVTERLHGLVLPSVALGAAAAAAFARQTRGAMITAFQQDYIRTALAKGLPRRTIVMKHAFKNAAIPIVTLIGFQVSTLLSAAVFVEVIFNIPGIANWSVNAVLRNNTPVIQAFVMLAAIVVCLVNVVLDVAYGWLNPRVRT